MIIKTIMQNLISIFVIFGFLLIAYEIIISYKKQKTLRVKDILNKQTLYNIQKHALRWLVGAVFLYSGLAHVLIPKIAASAIGWKVSPFQKEVGYYDIFVGGAGILSSLPIGEKFIPGTILIFGGFSFLAGLNHLYELIFLKNTSQHNSGLVLFTDIVTPIILTYTLLN